MAPCTVVNPIVTCVYMKIKKIELHIQNVPLHTTVASLLFLHHGQSPSLVGMSDIVVMEQKCYKGKNKNTIDCASACVNTVNSAHQ